MKVRNLKSRIIKQFLDVLNENNNDIDIVNNILLKAKDILLEHINL